MGLLAVAVLVGCSLLVVGAYLISLRVFFLFLFLPIHPGLDCASVAFIISILQLEELFHRRRRRRRRRRWSSSSSSSNDCGFASF